MLMQSGQLSSCDPGLSPADIAHPSTLSGHTPTSQHSGGDIATVIIKTYRIKVRTVLLTKCQQQQLCQQSLSALQEDGI